MLSLPSPSLAVLKVEGWIELKSENFSVITNLSESAGRKHVSNFEQFRAIALGVTGIPAERTRPLSVLLLSSIAEINRVLPQHPPPVTYYEQSLRGEQVVLSTEARGWIRPGEGFNHLYVHHLTRDGRVAYPRWYDEGLADLLSTTKIENGEITLYGLLERRVSYLPVVSEQITLGEVLNKDETWGKWCFWAYRLAWGTLNYMYTSHLRGGENYALKLPAYLDLVLQGADRDVAFKTAFGITTEEMSNKVERHFTRRHLRAFKADESRFPFNDNAIVRKVSAPEMLHKLANLVTEHKPDSAALMFKELLALDSSDSLAKIGLARTALKNGDMETAFNVAELAVSEPNLRTYLELGNLILQLCADPPSKRPQCEQLLARAAESFEAAFDLDHGNAEALLGKGLSVYYSADSAARALPYIVAALQQQPWSPKLNYWRGRLHRETGETDRAMIYLQRAANWNSDEVLQYNIIALMKELNPELESRTAVPSRCIW